MSDYSAPNTALDAFDILTHDLDTADTFTAAIDLTEQIADSGNVDDAVAERAEELATDTEPDDGVETLRDFLATIPFAAVAELGAGGESSYRDGLVSLWTHEHTQGYGRDRPGADKGFYAEVKLHLPWKVRGAIEAALEPFGIDAEDVYNAVITDTYYLESDALDWVLERDWDYELEGYPALTEAYKDGRIKRAYKGIYLANYITIAEVLEVQHYMESGRLNNLAEMLAIDWQRQTLARAIEIAFGLDETPDFDMDEDGVFTLHVWGDDDKAKLAKVAKKAAKGKRLRKVTTTTFVME